MSKPPLLGPWYVTLLLSQDIQLHALDVSKDDERVHSEKSISQRPQARNFYRRWSRHVIVLGIQAVLGRGAPVQHLR